MFQCDDFAEPTIFARDSRDAVGFFPTTISYIGVVNETNFFEVLHDGAEMRCLKFLRFFSSGDGPHLHPAWWPIISNSPLSMVDLFLGLVRIFHVFHIYNYGWPWDMNPGHALFNSFLLSINPSLWTFL